MLSAVFIPTAPWERAPSPFCSGGLRHMVAAAASLPLSREQKTSSGGLRGSQHCPPPFLGHVLSGDQVRTCRRPEGGHLTGCSRRMLSPPRCVPGPRGHFRGDLGGHRGGPALAVLWSTAARSPSSGQATNRRAEDGRVGKGENLWCFWFFF